MVGLDGCMWFLAFPVVAVFVMWQMVFNHPTGDTARMIAAITTGTVLVLVYPLYFRHLIRRRRLWRA
jgi:hypothetical protein